MALGGYRLILAFSLGFGERRASLCIIRLRPMRLHRVSPALDATKLGSSEGHCAFRCVDFSAGQRDIFGLLGRHVLLGFGITFACRLVIRFGATRFRQSLVCGDKFGFRRCQFLGGGFNITFEDPWPPFRLTSLERNWHRFNINLSERKYLWNSRCERVLLVRIAFLAANEQVGRRIDLAIVSPWNAVASQIGFCWNTVHPYVVGLEERTHPVVIDLLDRIELMVVAFCTVHRQAEEPFADVLYCLVQPNLPVE